MKPAELARETGPILWRRSLGWLALLAPLFFISYNFANQYAANQAQVPSLMLSWESAIPLLPWTIIPYWSIDLLYGLAFLLPRSRRGVDRLGLRLLTAQLICISCFLIWPLKFSLERPELTGVFGSLFDLLMGFDKPFNQAPSLHITLLIVLWACFAAHLRGPWRYVMHVWMALIGISVLTTWQHHFIDVPTGILAGALCLWCWPQQRPSPLLLWQGRIKPQLKLACLYLIGSALFGCLGWYGFEPNTGLSLLLFWPSLALFLVALNYAFVGATGFQKQGDGRLSWAAKILFAPYTLAAWVNHKLWTANQVAANEVVPGVFLGRKPNRHEIQRYLGLVDLCPELPVTLSSHCHYKQLDVLDLTPLTPEQCWSAAKAIDSLNPHCHSPLLVFCALGYSRSSVALMAWLLLAGHASSVEQAYALVAKARPQVVIKPHHLQALAELITTADFKAYQRHRSHVSQQNQQQRKMSAVQA
ncbi:phosphatase PAP2/dual specificity phosphatase family protein [Motilimonas eburnea]|uniref:phosphatase PAP2/dual specificity phosphatase family protein n=1 Tax=Motilimonas eburnea TaxID=1737488 RepID=UPI001E532C9F|nr:phosphatase PAP2/dual specificity phosphatase family protein [Motilimonas eburnea]MCE2570882.1 phosphatase PAP2/dual specificity phosphatase family protein [Motilimonas eburnea]